MTRTITTDLQNHIAGEYTTLAILWKITRTDSAEFFFTDHNKDIVYDGDTYEASTGFDPTAIVNKADFSVDNMDVEGILSSSGIGEDDLQEGKFDLATVEIMIVNYADLTQDKITLMKGTIGRVTIVEGKYTAEIRSLSERMQQNIGRVYTPTCDAILGDTRCGVTLASFTTAATVTSVTSNLTFADTSLNQAAGYFSGGQLTWTSGNNNGISIEIKSFLSSVVTLVLPMSNAIQVGDTFNIIAGCDKRSSTCKNTFSNLDNFRGFPDIPGTNEILKTAGTFRD